MLLTGPFTCRHSRPANAHSNPFAVQRVGPLSLLCDEDHAAPLLLLLALPQFDLCIAHRHHPLLHCAYTHAAAGARQGGIPGDGGFRGEVPGRRQEVNKMKGSNADSHKLNASVNTYSVLCMLPVCMGLGRSPTFRSLQRGNGDDGLPNGAQHGARTSGLSLIHVGL